MPHKMVNEKLAEQAKQKIQEARENRKTQDGKKSVYVSLSLSLSVSLCISLSPSPCSLSFLSFDLVPSVTVRLTFFAIYYRMSVNGGARPKRAFVVGVGVTKFEKPLTKEWDYPDMGREAGTIIT